jgi:hypothetical protein
MDTNQRRLGAPAFGVITIDIGATHLLVWINFRCQRSGSLRLLLRIIGVPEAGDVRRARSWARGTKACTWTSERCGGQVLEAAAVVQGLLLRLSLR